MPICRCFALCLLSLIVCLNDGLASNSQAATGRTYMPGQVIVKFKNEVGRVESSPRAQSLILKAGAFSMAKVFPSKQYDHTFTTDKIGLGQIYSLHVPSTTDVAALAERLARDPTVQYAEPNYLAYSDSTVPNDPSYSQEQHLPQVKAAQAWDIAQGDTSVIIAVLDTGTDWDHPDLASAIWTNNAEIPNNGVDDDGNGYVDDTRGWDFVDGITGGTGATDPDPNDDLNISDNNPMDYAGHGTHVSGIVGAVTNNSIGIASLAWKCKIMPLRIAYHTNDDRATGAYSWIAEAFVYAVDNGACAANLSFGPIISQLAFDAARYAFLHGAVVCNSAGNSNTESISELGAQSFALAVASVGKDDKKASYSSFGAGVDISAPGGSSVDGGILSTIVNPSVIYGNQLYTRFQGTSMSSPMVASLAGLIKSYHPLWTPAQIMFQIAGTADNIDALNTAYAGKLGSGRINAYRALTETPPPPLPKLSFVSVSVSDSAGGNNDGRLDPGETGSIIVTIENDWGDASGVTVSFSANHPAITVGNSVWNVGSFNGISDLNNSVISNKALPFTVTVHSQAVPMVIPCSLTLTANGGITLVRQFNLSITPSVLFVNDNDIGGDGTDVEIESYYDSGFLNNNISYASWDHVTKGGPPASILNNYSVVVWGCEWAFPALDSVDRVNLGAFLDAGGRLFLSGQDIAWDLCDATGTEYTASGGSSKNWFETYLGARYLADDGNGGAATTTLNGVAGDSIGNGFIFSAAQPGRASADQYPDVVQSLAGASDVFRYSDNRAGAVRFNGGHRSVYFSFGGLEAISNPLTRDSVLSKVYSWLQQASLDFTMLTDQEDSTGPSPVTAQVYSGIDPILSVELYWDTDQAFPFNVVPMTNKGGGMYSASVPAQSKSTDVDYFVLVKTTGGALPVQFRKFHVGIDRIPPQVSFNTIIQNSIKRNGPYPVKILATDNIKVDTGSVYLYYNIGGAPDDSVRLHLTAPPDTFAGAINFASPVAGGSTINYYIRVRDASISKNETHLPSQGYASFKIGLEMIDDFEQTRPKWDYGVSWGRSTSFAKSGLYSITDSPVGNYQPDATNTLTLLDHLDLSGYNAARLFYWRTHFLGAKDTTFVEQSTDGVTWTVSTFMWGTKALARDSINLPSGAGSENVRVRFRLRSHPLVESDGVYLDNIEVKTDSFLLTGIHDVPEPQIPVAYALSQNYPNPFNPETHFDFQILNFEFVSLKVFNVLGQEVATLVNEIRQPGSYGVTWNASNVPSGVYFYRLVSGQFSNVKKMLLLK